MKISNSTNEERAIQEQKHTQKILWTNSAPVFNSFNTEDTVIINLISLENKILDWGQNIWNKEG